jgi:DNA-binding transcriptional regulator YiaG
MNADGFQCLEKIRSRLKMSKDQFAMMIGVSKATLQNWEQSRRKPEEPAKALLTPSWTKPPKLSSLPCKPDSSDY